MSSWSVHHYASSPVWDMFDLPVVSNFLRRQYREHVFSGLSAVRLFTAVCGEGVMATLNEISERVGEYGVEFVGQPVGLRHEENAAACAVHMRVDRISQHVPSFD